MFKNLLNKVKSNDLFLEYWPTIEKLIIKKVMPQVIDKLKEDDEVELILRKTFELLPTTIRLLTTREKFVRFFMNKKESIIKLIEDYRKELLIHDMTQLSVDKNQNVIISDKCFHSEIDEN